MSDMKKLLSVLSESTTSSASIANGTPSAKGFIKRSSDTIFAEDSPEQIPTSAETSKSPSNFGLWKNSAAIGREQKNIKKVPVDKTKMYPQIAESYKQSGQSDIDDLASSRRNAERNAGLNEPDELVPDYGNNKEREFGTWYFTYQDGSIVIKDGRPLLSSTAQGVRDVIAIAKKHGIAVKSHEGAPPKLSESSNKASEDFPEDMADYTEEDWERWDAKVDRVGELAKAHDNREATKRKQGSNGNQGMAEATGDNKFDSMMGDITSPEALDTNEALALIRDLVYGGGASYEEALHQASVSFGINRAKLHALYKKQGMMEDTGDKKFDDMMKRVVKKPTQAQRNAERIRQKKEREAETKAHFANGGGFGPSPADKLSIRKTGTTECVNQPEITEEVIADRLKNELALFKKGTKAKNTDLSKKPVSKEIQKKKAE